MTKLLQFYSNYLTATRGESGTAVALAEPTQTSEQWIDEVARHYSLVTLERMLTAYDSKTRRAAAWALQFHGTENNSKALGYLLSDRDYFTRRTADNARRSIQQRSQSSVQRQVISQAENFMMLGRLENAESLMTLLVNESEPRSDIYALRAFIRFAQCRIELAAEDCKASIQLDPFAYRSFVALGQCFWHQLNNGAARECYLEAARIYPDWRPAHAGINLVADR